MDFPRRYDAVVVGGGNGGMTAACRLAVDGYKVLLLERHNILGGFSTSFVRGRFEFEASLHELCQVGPEDNPGNVRQLFDDLGVQVEWLRIPEAYRLILSETGVDAKMPFGVPEYIDAMERYVPGSREVTTKFFDLCREICDALAYIGKTKGKGSKSEMMKRFPNFLKTAAYSVEDVCRSLGMSQAVKNILYAYWCYLSIPMDRMNMTLFGAMFYFFLIQGAYIPRCRSTEFALAVEKRIRDAGGTVELGAEVKKIFVENGRVVGVQTASGERVGTSQVVCNASPTAAYLDMVEPASACPLEAKRWLGARSESLAGFVVFLGLDASPDELGLTDYSYFVYRDMDTNRLYDSFKTLDRPQVQATVCLNRAVPDCSPPGTSILSFTVLHKPSAWDGVKLEDYFDRKRRIADWLIEDFEKATGVSVRDHIEEIEIAAAPTYARYTGAPGGIIYGYETDSWDATLPRTMMMDEDEIIKGLKFASGYGSRTLGFSSALIDGQTKALLVERDLRAEREAKA